MNECSLRSKSDYNIINNKLINLRKLSSFFMIIIIKIKVKSSKKNIKKKKIILKVY